MSMLEYSNCVFILRNKQLTVAHSFSTMNRLDIAAMPNQQFAEVANQLASSGALTEKQAQSTRTVQRSKRKKVVMYSNNAGGRALSQQQRKRARLAQKKLNAGASEAEIMRIVQPCLDLERRNEEIASLVQSTNSLLP
jgi:hypothetical protein